MNRLDAREAGALRPEVLLESPAIRAALVLALVVGLVLSMASHRSAAELERAVVLDVPVLPEAAVPSGRILRFASLGYTEAFADLMWLDGLSFYGDTRGVGHSTDFLEPHLQTIATLDPNFELVFLWAATLVMYGASFNNETVSASNRVLEQGLQRFPLSWEIRFMLACNYLYELRPDNDAQAAEWRELGTSYLLQAAELPNAPSWVQAAASSYLRRGSRWNDATLIAQSQWLDAQNFGEARNARAQLESLLGPSASAPILANRQVLRLFSFHPFWNLSPVQQPLVLHPAPAFTMPVDLLAPAPFHLTL